MADVENRVDKLEEKYFNLHTVVNVMAAKADATNEKIDNFIAEMRDQNRMRAEEISENRTEMQSIGRHVRNLTIASIVGIGAIAASSIAIAIAVIYTVMK